MIKPNSYGVYCDECDCRFGPRFIHEYQAKDWLADKFDDFDEYGQFSDGVPHVGDVFHKIGGRLYCLRCTEKEIEKTKNQSPGELHQ